MDISSRDDIKRMVNCFYEKVKKDELIGFIFNDVMKMDWEQHLPVMYNFWDTILLDASNYTRNTMTIHFEVNRKIRLEEKHFKRWLELFTSTIDELFNGAIADMAKIRAGSIAAIMQLKMKQENTGPGA